MFCSWSWLIVALLGVLLAEESDASGICGKEYKNVKVRPLANKVLDKAKGDWFVVAVYESEPRSFNNVQCLHYHYQLTKEPNVFNVTKQERFINQTRVQIEQKYIFQQTNNSIVFHPNMQLDPALTLTTTFLDYNVNAPSFMDNYLINYGCIPGQGQEKDYTIFVALSRVYCATQSPTVTAAVEQALVRVGLQKGETKNFYNAVCGVENPNLDKHSI